jgi:hypothetical protein
LQSLPFDSFNSPNDVSEAFGKKQARSAPASAAAQ